MHILAQDPVPPTSSEEEEEEEHVHEEHSERDTDGEGVEELPTTPMAEEWDAPVPSPQS